MIEDFSFKDNYNLSKIYFQNNKIKKVSINTFKGLVSLVELNLEQNQIKSIYDILYDYSFIETFKMGNNRLETYPSFEMTQIDIDTTETFLEFNLNQNQIKSIKYFSFIFETSKL